MEIRAIRMPNRIICGKAEGQYGMYQSQVTGEIDDRLDSWPSRPSPKSPHEQELAAVTRIAVAGSRSGGKGEAPLCPAGL